MIMEGKYGEIQEYRDILNEQVKASKAVHWRSESMAIYQRFGYVGFWDEVTRYDATHEFRPPNNMEQALEAEQDLEKAALDAKMELVEANHKCHIDGLQPAAFKIKGAYKWYKLSQDDNAKFCSIFATHVLGPAVKAHGVDKSPEQSKQDAEEDARLEELERSLAQ